MLFRKKPRGQIIGNGINAVMLTPEGGMAIRLYNKSGAASVKGMLVTAGTTLDFSFGQAVADSDSPLGVVYESGIPDGQLCWVVYYGIAEILLQDSTASTHGYWVRTSITQAGRADATNPDPPPGGIVAELEDHFHEIGHCLESVTAGTNKLAKIVMHFN